MKKEKGISLIAVLIIVVIGIVGMFLYFSMLNYDNKNEIIDNSSNENEIIDNSINENNTAYTGNYGSFDWNNLYLEYNGKKYNKTEMAYLHRNVFSNSKEFTTDFDFNKIAKPQGATTEKKAYYKDTANETEIGFGLLNFTNEDVTYAECPTCGITLFEDLGFKFSFSGVKIGDTRENVYRILGKPDEGDDNKYTSWVYYKDGNKNNKADCLYIWFDDETEQVKSINLVIYEVAKEAMKNN